MSNSEELIDQNATRKQRQRTFQSFSMLSYIGNGLWGALFLILFLACIINGKAVLQEGEDVSRITFYLVVSGLIVTASLFCIIGVLRMKKGKKKGFYMYVIGNLVWITLLFYDSIFGLGTYGIFFPLMAGVSAIFIIYFALRLPKLS